LEKESWRFRRVSGGNLRWWRTRPFDGIDCVAVQAANRQEREKIEDNAETQGYAEKKSGGSWLEAGREKHSRRYLDKEG
jgi:hypothetical protein